ncbi:MAG: hypothetical protein AAB214_04905, partial [Fibrobacterota bacterium]
NGSASSSLSVGGSAVATASASGLSIPSLSAGGMLKAGAGGLLQAASISDLTGGPYLTVAGGPYLPLAGGTISGSVQLNNYLNMYGDLYMNTGRYIHATGWYTQDYGLYSTGTFTFDGSPFVFATRIVPNSGIAGTTGGANASSGDIGECIAAALDNTSAITLTTGVGVDVVSISVPAGDWNLFAAVNGRANTSAVSRFRTAISDSSTTVISDGYEGDSTLPTGSGVGERHVLKKRVSFTGPNRTYYLAAILTGTFGSGNCWGSILARRAR